MVHWDIQETGFLETCTHMLKIPNCQEALTTPYLLWSLQDRGEDNFSAFLPLNIEKSNFIRGGRGACYAWVSWTHARRAWMRISADTARLVLHGSPGKAWSREGSCLVQQHWSKRLSSGYMLPIPEAERGQWEIKPMEVLSQRHKIERKGKKDWSEGEENIQDLEHKRGVREARSLTAF